jgi:hypothetical protein
MKYYNPALAEAGFMDLVIELKNRYAGFEQPIPGISDVHRAAMLELDRVVNAYIKSVDEVTNMTKIALLYPDR